jgi:hypothetical protein
VGRSAIYRQQAGLGIAVGTWIGVGLASIPVMLIGALMLGLATSDNDAARYSVHTPGIWALAAFVSTGILVVGAGTGAAIGGAVGGLVRALNRQ